MKKWITLMKMGKNVCHRNESLVENKHSSDPSQPHDAGQRCCCFYPFPINHNFFFLLMCGNFWIHPSCIPYDVKLPESFFLCWCLHMMAIAMMKKPTLICDGMHNIVHGAFSLILESQFHCRYKLCRVKGGQPLYSRQNPCPQLLFLEK